MAMKYWRGVTRNGMPAYGRNARTNREHESERGNSTQEFMKVRYGRRERESCIICIL